MANISYFDEITKKKVEAKATPLKSEVMMVEAALSPTKMSQEMSRPSINLRTDDVQGGRPYNMYSYNADQLRLEDYQAMLKDPQVKSGLDMIKTLLLTRELIVLPASEEDSDKEIATELEDMLNNMDYPLRKARMDMYSALEFGYSVSEIIWETSKDKKSIRIKAIRPIDIETFDFDDPFKYDDETGLLMEIVQSQMINGDDIKIPAEKALVYTYDERFGDRRGRSILDAVYDNWYAKTDILDWYNLFLEKHQAPTLLGKVQNSQYAGDLLDNMESIKQGRANIVIGPEDSVEVMEASKSSADGFKEALNYHDTIIYRKLGIGTLIMGQEDNSGGAYAQSKTQNNMLYIMLDGIHADIASELQIKCNEWVDLHYDVEGYPRISFTPFEEKDTLTLLTSMKPLVDGMIINPKAEWLQKLVASTVSRYSDLDISDILDEEPPEEEAQNPEEEQQIQEEASREEIPPEEQAALLENMKRTIPGQEEVKGTAVKELPVKEVK